MNLGELFPGVEVVDAHFFRIIRDTAIDVHQEGDDDLLESVDRGLKALSHGLPSLLQVEATMPRRVVTTLVENFEVRRRHRRPDARSVWVSRTGWRSTDCRCRDLKDTPFVPRMLWDVAQRRSRRLRRR